MINALLEMLQANYEGSKQYASTGPALRCVDSRKSVSAVLKPAGLPGVDYTVKVAHDPDGGLGGLLMKACRKLYPDCRILRRHIMWAIKNKAQKPPS